MYTPSATLIERLHALMPEDIWYTPIPKLVLVRLRERGEINAYVQEPAVCFLLQGRKEIELGAQTLHHTVGEILCYPVGIPVRARIDPALPHLGVAMLLDGELMARYTDAAPPPTTKTAKTEGVITASINTALGNAFERLLTLLDTPADIPHLAPLIQQEIYYRLLSGEQGASLRQMVLSGSHTRRITRAAQWLQQHYAEPLQVETLAQQIGMSPSSFYQHFRQITTMSPLQYQKALRLAEASRLLRQQKTTIAAIAQQVGYESQSQFSREYSRHFGITPRSDVMV